MTRKKAIQAMLDGEKVKHPNFSATHYCFYDEAFALPFRVADINSRPSIPMYASLNYVHDWEIIKAKKKMWLWVIQSVGFSSPYLTTGFFATKEEAESNLHTKDDKIIQRADWTMIEVEINTIPAA